MSDKPVLAGDDLKTYWWRRLAGTWRHGGVAAAMKQFHQLWPVARRDGLMEHLELLRRVSKALSEVYEYLPQFTAAEALTITTGREVDALIEKLSPTQKGDENHDSGSSKEA